MIHVLDIHKNLVSRSLLSKNGFKLLFVSNKFILTRMICLWEKGYFERRALQIKCNGCCTKVISDKNNVYSSYLIEPPNVWHGMIKLML